MNCQLAHETVHGYCDGELDAVRSAEFERHLGTCSECQAELKNIGSLRKRLQESDLFEPASPQLLGRIRKQIAEETNGSRGRSPSARRWFLVPTFAALAAAAASFAIVFFGFQFHSHSMRMCAPYNLAISRMSFRPTSTQ